MNRIVTTDILEGISYSKRKGLKFDLAICDPPYNAKNEFDKSSRSMSHESYIRWTEEWLKGVFELLKQDGLVYVYGFAEVLAHIAVGFSRENQKWLQWHYTNKTVPRSKFWQRSHESILCLWNQKKPPLQVDQIREPYTESYLKCVGKVRKDVQSRFGKDLTKYNVHKKGALPRDVIKVPALAGGAGYKERWFKCEDCGDIYPPSRLKDHRDHKTWKHPTQKPMSLTRRLIQSKVKSDDMDASILIPFAGSGSECIVAKRLGVNFLGFEISPTYAWFANRWLELEPCFNPVKPKNHVLGKTY